MKELIDQYFEIQEAVHKAFGYEENWVAIPLDDARSYYWRLDATYDRDGKVIGGDVAFADTIEDLEDEEAGNYYANEIYTQRFLSQWVYRTDEFTMICVDTHVDGNKFLQIFDNAKEIKS
jgi:hypothetical protein